MTEREMNSMPDTDRISDPGRLAALQRLSQLDQPAGAFERLARVAAAALNAPLALVSLIDASTERLVSAVGLPDLWPFQQDLPLERCFCRDVVTSGKPLLVGDVSGYPELAANQVVQKLNLAAYAGVPLLSGGDQVIGVVAVGDHRPREWSAGDVERLSDLAALMTTEIDLRCEVAERRLAEQERDTLIAALQQRLRTQERFLSIAAHELRTPLTSLLGSAQLLQRHLDPRVLAERDRRLLAGLASDVLRLDRMIESLLDVSRAQTGRLSISRAPLDLTSLVWQAIQLIKADAERERIIISGPVRPLVVLGDGQRLGQVVDHLLQNALAYSPAGGPIEVQIEERQGMASVAVSDRGIGIPDSVLPKLFSPFYRAPNVRALRAGGLGIGLFLVQQIVALHGGGVEVTSEEFEGSTFRFYLPLVETGGEDAADKEAV